MRESTARRAGAAGAASAAGGDRARYVPPARIDEISLLTAIEGVREVPPNQRQRLLIGEQKDDSLYYAGDVGLIRRKCVAIVGARKVSEDGRLRAGRLARELVQAGVVVVSGLAEGVDTAAHQATLAAGGRTVAVIGTHLGKAYPAANAELQERIYREHLLVSPFELGAETYPSNFPFRNRIMAALSDATVIIEASDESGSLHQAAECAPGRLNRWLFIARSLIDKPGVTWPKRFLDAANRGARVRVLERTEDVLSVLR